MFTVIIKEMDSGDTHTKSHGGKGREGIVDQKPTTLTNSKILAIPSTLLTRTHCQDCLSRQRGAQGFDPQV